jgi:hypothetical protein
VNTLSGLALEEPLEEHVELLQRWFFSRSYGLRYETAANTVTVDEYRALRAAVVDSRPLPEEVVPAVVEVRGGGPVTVR